MAHCGNKAQAPVSTSLSENIESEFARFHSQFWRQDSYRSLGSYVCWININIDGSILILFQNILDSPTFGRWQCLRDYTETEFCVRKIYN